MINLFIALNTTIFLFISGIHFYWMFGGKWGLSAALPEMANNKILNPSAFSTFVVAFGLLVFAGITIGQTGVFYFLPLHFFIVTNYCIATIFLLRAVGDFRYIGVFRKVNTTTFGIHDKKYFTPLCLIICVNCILIAILH